MRRLTPRAPSRRDVRVRGRSTAIRIRPLSHPATLLRELGPLSPGNRVSRGNEESAVPGTLTATSSPRQGGIAGSGNRLIAAITVRGPDEKILKNSSAAIKRNACDPRRGSGSRIVRGDPWTPALERTIAVASAAKNHSGISRQTDWKLSSESERRATRSFRRRKTKFPRSEVSRLD